jgi:signal transduction histidine kinase/ActR/RegA family two-component response regulator
MQRKRASAASSSTSAPERKPRQATSPRSRRGAAVKRRANPEESELRERLREAEETIQAICNGEVDAVVVRNVNGPQVYSLAGAERPYRVYVERMQEGAVTVSREGLILYSNRRFAEMVEVPLERVISSDLQTHLGGEAWKIISRVLLPECGVVKQECVLLCQNRVPLPVHVTASHLPLGDQDVLCLVITDLTEQKEKADLRLGKELAEKASLAKDSFIAALSHELRTPLTPALIAASALEKDPKLPAFIRSEIELIRRNIELEARLIDDLLDLTRIARGKLELHATPMDVREIVKRAVEICRTDLDDKKHQLRLELEAQNTATVGDPVRIQQAIWNVLRNAAKFTPPAGVITVRTRKPSTDVIQVIVTDTGIGFGPDVQNKLFQSFEQGGRHVTREFGGLGLGLTITRSIVEAHGGTIRGHSAGPGKGARFTLELPIVSTAPQHSPATREQPAITNPEPRLRILLVEDHRDSRVALERLLTLHHHKVRSVETAREALGLAATEAFDVVISDLGLPDMSGIELMRHLRSALGLRGVALSGYGMEQDIAESRDAGFCHHLTKPVRLEQLRKVIASIGQELFSAAHAAERASIGS